MYRLMGKFLQKSFYLTILDPFSIPFILTFFIKGNQIEHFTHPGPYPGTIALFKFFGIEVGGGMGLAFIIDEELVT